MQRGLDAILERQMHQLRSLGIALLALTALWAVVSVYMMAANEPLISRFYAFSGLLVFGGSGIAALQRSRQAGRALAERRREDALGAAKLPTAVARDRRPE